jgi:hypothetical protein
MKLKNKVNERLMRGYELLNGIAVAALAVKIGLNGRARSNEGCPRLAGSGPGKGETSAGHLVPSAGCPRPSEDVIQLRLDD